MLLALSMSSPACGLPPINSIKQPARFKDRGWAILHEWNENIFRDDCTDEAIDRTLARLKTAREKITKETAALTVKWAEDEPLEKPVFHFTAEEPIAEFRKVKGEWKIDANAETGLEKPADFFQKGSWGRAFRAMMNIEREMISAIAKGEFGDEEATIAAFEKKLHAEFDGGESGRESAKKEAAQAKIQAPAATDLDTGRLAWPSSHRPLVAVSESGVLYVFWLAKGRYETVRSPVLPLIPKEVAFGPAADPHWSAVPGVHVFRKGAWSKPGVLLEGAMDCSPSFAWCAGEKLHLLVTADRSTKTHHLIFDPVSKRWTLLAELPHVFTHTTAFRVVGSSVHAAFTEGGRAYHLRFDGKTWGKPVPLTRDNLGNVAHISLAVDRAGVVHVAWWSSDTKRGTHRYAIVRDGKVSIEALHFETAPIDGEEFDLGVDPRGRVLLAYKPDLPEEHADSLKVHVCHRTASGWSDAKKLASEAERLHGDIRIVGNDKRTLVTWTQTESYYQRGSVLVRGYRRLAMTDGKSWSSPRWIAREPTLRGNGRPVGALNPSICVDKDGGVHMVWGICSYCRVARLAADEAKK